MENLLLLIFGIYLCVCGSMNIQGNIRTIHAYNRRRVAEVDVPKYGRAVGSGSLVMGISLIVSYAVTFWNEAVIVYIVIPAVVIGFALILYGQFKYNHGIF